MFWIDYIIAIFVITGIAGLVYANIKPHKEERMY